MSTTATDTIENLYEALNPRSKLLFDEQREFVAGGSTHLARQTEPFPLFIEENWGARKRDVDGHEYIDYWLGHGSMLLGHRHPTVLRALSKQAEKSIHAGGETETASHLARMLQRLVPSAERVRFVATGGEATQLAIRLARAYTGKDRIVKIQGGFHGWHDGLNVALSPTYGAPGSPGVPRAVIDQVIAVPINDASTVERLLTSTNDIAGFIMEPGGPSNDTVFSSPDFLRAIRELTSQHQVVLIFDEVVTGFRYALGGVQEQFGVTPDLTALGKVMGGGLPVGAVVGVRDIMSLLDSNSDGQLQGLRWVPHPGTWNALPLVTAAGLAALSVAVETDAVARARSIAEYLVDGLNSVFTAMKTKAFAYTRSSIFKICPGEPPPSVRGEFSASSADSKQLFAGWGPLASIFRKAMLLEGVDLMRTAGFVSSAHTKQDADATCEALGRTIHRIRREGLL